MRKMGEYFMFFGIGSMVLYLFEHEFVLMSWVDTWGTGFGWTIRVVMSVVGLYLFLTGKRHENV